MFDRNFLAAGYREKICTVNGDYYLKFNHSDVCYYVGDVRGYVGSTASLSTCDQLSGFFVAGDDAYSIVPVKDGHFTEAIVDKEYIGNWNCGVLSSLKEVLGHKSKRSLGDKIDTKTRMIELYIVGDTTHRNQFSSDIEASQRLKDIANTVNALYNTVAMYVVLVGLEIWTTPKLNITSNSAKVLSDFYDYKNNTLNKMAPSHDNACLIVAQAFTNNIAGLAEVGSMCNSIRSGSIISDRISQGSGVGLAGALMTHEMGHNLGLGHDTETSPCPCGDVTGSCIMSPSLSSRYPTMFSSCSQSNLVLMRRQGLDLCLFNIPQMMSSIFSVSSICGNGIIEQGEECDCGGLPYDLCNTACCTKDTCKLIGPAKCAMGTCCNLQTCEIYQANTICRELQGPCDIQELCDGITPLCPLDTYKPDGVSCTVAGSSAYCYQGKCQNHDSQCQYIWSPNSRSSSDGCYSLFNGLGDYSGSCQIVLDSTISYTACNASNVKCGQLFCVNVGTPALVYERYYLNYAGSNACAFPVLDFGIQILTPAFVPNGAVCGASKTCINQTCVDVNVLLSATVCPSCPGGTCDNKGQCRCENGQQYPNCTENIFTPIVLTTTKRTGLNHFSAIRPEKHIILFLLLNSIRVFVQQY